MVYFLKKIYLKGTESTEKILEKKRSIGIMISLIKLEISILELSD